MGKDGKPVSSHRVRLNLKPIDSTRQAEDPTESYSPGSMKAKTRLTTQLKKQESTLSP